MLIFSEQNVIKDPPFSRLDLISCRNLLIYMRGSLQKRLIPAVPLRAESRRVACASARPRASAGFDELFGVLDGKSKIYQPKGRDAGRSVAGPGRRITPYRGGRRGSRPRPARSPPRAALSLREIDRARAAQAPRPRRSVSSRARRDPLPPRTNRAVPGAEPGRARDERSEDGPRRAATRSGDRPAKGRRRSRTP